LGGELGYVHLEPSSYEQLAALVVEQTAVIEGSSFDRCR
jgi:hypothetical protein